MRTFGPIVGIVNSWESCAPVLRRTAELASSLSTTASIIAVPETAPALWSDRRRLRFGVEMRVRQLVRETADVYGIEPEVSLPGGNVPVARRVHEASLHAALLVVNLTPPAFTPRSLFLSRLLGSARCPVLFATALFPAPYGKVLVPVDFTGRSAVAVEWAAKVAPAGTARLLHMLTLKDEQAMEMLDVPHWVIRDRWTARVHRAREALAEMCSSTDGPPRSRNFTVRRGDRLLDLVLDEQATVRADLVVASMNPMNPLSMLFGGALAVQLARRAQCDVLALPPKFLPRPRRASGSEPLRFATPGSLPQPEAAR